MSESRRLAAIVSADVAGYSRLMGQDESGTLAALKAIRREVVDPAVAAHHGRIVKTTGDGLLLEFASVVDAVRCVVAAQTAMAAHQAAVPEDRRIAFRIGINVGDIIIDGDDIFGDGVNLAARLQEIAAPGGICLSRAAREQIGDRLEVMFEDAGEQGLKNIARPVRVWRWRAGGMPSGAPTSAVTPAGAPPHLSIVVLPFANIGGDAEQEYFVDGVTESLTTDLSRMQGMLVIGRNTAFTYKGKHVDLKQVGRELGVRYVLEGSMQRGGNRIRINVQLIDAGSGNHLWAERFDKPLADLFEMQDEIVTRLARALDTQLVAAEARRAERAPHPGSTDLYFQGMACVNQGSTPELLARAQGFFARALTLAPDNIDALVGMASVESVRAGNHMTDDRRARVAAAEVLLTKALSLAPDHAAAHAWLGYVQIQSGRAEQRIAACERALALDRNLAWAHGVVGIGKWVIGQAEETEAQIREALRLSPRDGYAYYWLSIAATAKFLLGEDEAAAAGWRRAIEANRNYPLAHFYLAAAAARLGRLDEARSAAQTGLALDPGFTIRRYRTGTQSRDPAFLAQRERFYDGMRLAGIPE